MILLKVMGWASPSSCVPSGGVARWPKLTVRHSTKWRKGALSRAVLTHHLTPFDAHGQPRDRRFAIPINVIERNGD